MAKSIFTITTTPIKTVIPPSLREASNKILLAQNIVQAWGEHKDNQGSPLPDGIDLEDSGDLKDSGVSDSEGFGFSESYAVYVDRTYHFIGLSDESQRIADEQIERLFDEAGNALIEGEE